MLGRRTGRLVRAIGVGAFVRGGVCVSCRSAEKTSPYLSKHSRRGGRTRVCIKRSRIITESLAFLPSPSRSFSRFARTGTRTIALRPLVRQYQTALDSILQSHPELRRCVVRCADCGIRFLTHPRNARSAGLALSVRLPASTIAGSVPASGVPRTTERPAGKGEEEAAQCPPPIAARSVADSPQPDIPHQEPAVAKPPADGRPVDSPPADELPVTVRTAAGRGGARRVECGELADAAVRADGVSLIEGVELTCREVVDLLRQDFETTQHRRSPRGSITFWVFCTSTRLRRVSMSEIVELSSLDLRYEGHRLRDDAREARLLASIAERGIEEPLEGVDTPAARFLLNGFKRCRCGQEAGDRLRPLRVAGRGGGDGHPESDAGFDGQGAWAFWSRPGSSSICCRSTA